MTAEDFIYILTQDANALYDSTFAYVTDYRLGQSFTSCLARADTNLYSKMMQESPASDCFYDDLKIKSFLQYIRENYNE